MKKVLAILLTVVLAFGLFACASEEAATDTTATAEEASAEAESVVDTEETYELGVILMTLANESQAYFQKLYNELSADYGFEVTVYDGTDATVQSNAVRECIAQEVDAIIICVTDSSSIVPALQEAKAAGIPVGLLNTTIDVMDETTYDFHVGVDDVLAGEAAAEAFIANFPDGANVVEIGGAAGSSPATKRHDGFSAGLEGSNITVLEYQACEGWIANEAMTIMENMIVKYGDEIDGVYVHWDNGATTVIQALQAASMTDVFVVGVDGCRAGFDQVADGTQAVTIMQNFDKLIPTSLEIMKNVVTGQAFEADNILDWEIVTIDNISDFNYPQW